MFATKPLTLSLVLSRTAIVFSPFSVSLYSLFLSSHTISTRPFLSKEYNSEYTVPELTSRLNLLWIYAITS
jgi:hypothetical protein